MNGLDLLLLGILSLSAWRGFQKGLLGSVVSLAGWFVALFVGSKGAAHVAPHVAGITADPALQTVVAFVVLVLIVLVTLWGAVQIVRSLLQAVALGLLEQLAGAVFGVAKGLLILLIIISVIGPWAQKSPTWQQSTLAPALMPYAPLAMQVSKQVAEEAWDQVKSDAKP